MSNNRIIDGTTVAGWQHSGGSARYELEKAGKGLYLRLSKDGTRVWQAHYTVSGKSTSGVLGEYPAMSLNTALEQMERVIIAGREGINMLAKKKREAQEITKRIESENATFADLWDAFIPTVTTEAPRGKGRKDGGEEIIRQFRLHMAPLHKVPVRELSEALVLKTFRAISAKGNHATAKNTFGTFRQVLIWAAPRQPWKRIFQMDGFSADVVTEADILVGDYDPDEDGTRTRYLTEDEVRILPALFARSTLKPWIQSAVYIMLATGVRVNELNGAIWETEDEAGVDLARKVWTITKPTKNGKGHIIPLSDFAVEHFRRLQSYFPASRFVLPATHKGVRLMEEEKHISAKTIANALYDRQHAEAPKAKKRRCKDWESLRMPSGEDWKTHDLRRTCSTQLQRLKVSKTLIHRVLNHTVDKGEDKDHALDKHYLHHNYVEDMRGALDTWGATLAEWLEPPKPLQLAA